MIDWAASNLGICAAALLLLDGPPDEAVENWKAIFTALGMNHEGWENAAMKLLLTDGLVAVFVADGLLIAAKGANPSEDNSCFDSAWESKEFSQHYKPVNLDMTLHPQGQIL